MGIISLINRLLDKGMANTLLLIYWYNVWWPQTLPLLENSRVEASVAVINHHDQEQVMEGRIILVSRFRRSHTNSGSEKTTAGGRSRNRLYRMQFTHRKQRHTHTSDLENDNTPSQLVNNLSCKACMKQNKIITPKCLWNHLYMLTFPSEVIKN